MSGARVHAAAYDHAIDGLRETLMPQRLREAGLITAQIADLLECENQAHETNRAGMIWFCFYPPLVSRLPPKADVVAFATAPEMAINLVRLESLCLPSPD